MMFYENKQFFSTQNETKTRKEFSDEFVEEFMQNVLVNNKNIEEDEFGNPIAVESSQFEEEKTLKKVDELKLNLEQTDYVANKLSELIIDYLTSGNKTELENNINKYSNVLKQRKKWRYEINTLSNNNSSSAFEN